MLRYRKIIHISEATILKMIFCISNLIGMYLGTKVKWYNLSEERLQVYYSFQKVGGIMAGGILMIFIGGLRLTQLFFGSLLPTMKGGKVWCRFLVMEMGGWLGILAANMIKIHGIRGLVLLLLSLFPHTIFYGLCLKEVWNLFNSGISFQGKYATINKRSFDRGKHGVFILIKELLQNEVRRTWLRILLLEFIGIFMESFVNPLLMEWMFVG